MLLLLLEVPVIAFDTITGGNVSKVVSATLSEAVAMAELTVHG